jgi:hypothetical protein
MRERLSTQKAQMASFFTQVHLRRHARPDRGVRIVPKEEAATSSRQSVGATLRKRFFILRFRSAAHRSRSLAFSSSTA